MVFAQVSDISVSPGSIVTYVLVALNGVLLTVVATLLKEILRDFKDMRSTVADHETRLEVHDEKFKTLQNSLSKHNK